MTILGFSFLGVRVQAWDFDETLALYRDTLGLRQTKDEPGVAWFETETGEEIHVYGPGEHHHDFYTTGPVVGLLVSDFEETRARMLASGIVFIGEPQRSEGAVWNHYFGPDGNVYEIMERSK